MDISKKQIEDLAKEIEQKFSARLVSSIRFYDEENEPADIDFYTKDYELGRISGFLLQRGFVVSGREYGLSARKSLGGKLFYLDFSASPDLSWFPDVFCKPKFYEDLLRDRGIEKFLRYFVSFRGVSRGHNKKFSQYVRDNFGVYGKYLSDTTYLSKPLCRRGITAYEAVSVMENKPLYFLRVFGAARVVRIMCARLLFHTKKIFCQEGEIVAFVGPDGSGKSTSVNLLSRCIGTHKKYMGDMQFRLQPFYNWLWSLGVPLSYITYLFMYVEQWFRFFGIWLKKIKGDKVLTDRWPGFNQNVYGSKKRKSLYAFLYFFFPKPDKFVFLSAESEIIHKRKPELSVDEIEESQGNIRKLLRNSEHVEISTTDTDIDSSINRMMQYIFYGAELKADRKIILKRRKSTVVEFSGIFASGKSSTSRALVDTLRKLGYEVKTDNDMWKEVSHSSRIWRWFIYIIRPQTWVFATFALLSLPRKKVALKGRGRFKKILGPVKDTIDRERFIAKNRGADFVIFDGGSVYHTAELLWQFMLPKSLVLHYLRCAKYIPEARIILFENDVELSSVRTGDRGDPILVDAERDEDSRKRALYELVPYFDEAYEYVQSVCPWVQKVDPRAQISDRVSFCLRWLTNSFNARDGKI